MNQIVIVENLLSDEMIETVFSLVRKLNLEDSKVGKRVDPIQKVRQDCFLSSRDCAPIDSIILKSINKIVERDFGISIEYRERWKIGYYKGEDGGHYNAHTDIQGKMEHRQLSLVIALSDPADYQGGELYFREIDRSFLLKKGSCILFKPELVHEVRPVTSGERHMLISFMFDRENGLQSGRNLNQYTPQFTAENITPITPDSAIKHYRANLQIQSADTLTPKTEFEDNHTDDQYLLTISPDSGPGNQVMGFKEALVMGAILKRKVLLPPIHQHYTEGGRNWDFSEIFKYGLPDKVIEINSENRNLIPDKTYVLHGGYLNKQLKVETILDHNFEEQLVKQRHFRRIEDYEELAGIDDQVLCVKHLFNNTAISECLINGCHDCATNPVFESLFGEICKNFDFSDSIKNHGDQFIDARLRKDYIAVHLRYPDVMGSKTLKGHANYDEAAIHEALLELSRQENIQPSNIFIATNKVSYLQNSPLKEFIYYDVDHDDDINSFVEQYICCRAKVFVMSKYNDYANIDKPHQRSTWSTFVSDYRKHLRNNQKNVLLNEIIISN